MYIYVYICIYTYKYIKLKTTCSNTIIQELSYVGKLLQLCSYVTRLKI